MAFSHCALRGWTGRSRTSACQKLSAGKTSQSVPGGGTAPLGMVGTRIVATVRAAMIKRWAIGLRIGGVGDVFYRRTAGIAWLNGRSLNVSVSAGVLSPDEIGEPR